MDFDSILPEVGSFGLYQKLVICLVLLPAILPCAFHAYSQLFIAAKPNLWCKVPQLESLVYNYPEIVKELSIPREYRDGEQSYSECKMFVRNYSEIVRTLTDNSFYLNLIKMNKSTVLEELNQNLSHFETQSCVYGWNYDQDIFKSTVVMEVTIPFIPSYK